MLNLWSNSRSSQCDGTTRRDFLKVGALGMGGVMLPELLKSRAMASATGQQTKNTSVVWLWLGGGPTHVETFDPKMSAPVEFRSTTGAVDTNVPGIQIGGTFTKMARVADKMAFVRSFAHSNSGHGGGTHWVNTGYNFIAADNGGAQSKPSYGSILSRFRGANNPATGLPTYVRIGGNGFDGPSWLGSSYSPFDVGGAARRNMDLQITQDRLSDRRSMLRTFDSIDREIDRSGMMTGLDAFEGQAFNLLMGKARETFDVTREDARTQELYGLTGGNNSQQSRDLSRNLLLARRLCESGVGFVTVSYGGWDMHGQIKNNIEARTPNLDAAVASFLTDLSNRGLEKDILLVISGEFGRTPRINNNAGRDHWGPLSTLALAGGGLKMGQVVGESSSRAEVPKTTPTTPQDLMATIFHVLGMPRDLHFNDNTGRPVPMVNGGRAIQELI